ncbi:MAG: fructosamine kinase family protein [Myxococcales bacterium]|nr:fructosamine kinase family protein [Myxococcales bacterium]
MGSDIRPSDRAAIEAALGVDAPVVIADARALAGGDINEAWAVTLSDGRAVFAKTNPRAPARMFEVEARALAWLAEADALRVPAVLAVGPSFLVLELLSSARRQPDFDEALGRGLAALHRATPTTFGCTEDGFIGRLPQPNAPAPDWSSFYAERRLAPMLALAAPRDAALARRLDRLVARLPALVGPAEPPARLHGDLWGGNLHVDDRGAPCLIDPAAYGGHREVDLAMMRLFGGFGPRVFAAYDEAYPLAPGHEARVALYQLYPMLVHLALFGDAYRAGVERCLRAYE